MKFAIALVGLVLAVPAWPADDSALPAFLPADTRLVIGLEVKNLAASELVRTAGPNQNMDFVKFMMPAGFDLFRDLDDVLFTTNGDGQNSPVLIVAHGRFAALHMGEGVKQYHNLQLGNGKQDGAAALVNESTVILGDVARVREAYSHRARASHLDAALVEAVGSMRGHYDVWGYGRLPEGFVPKTPQSQGLDSVDQFQFGFSVAHGLNADIELHVRNTQESEKLMAGVYMLEGMLKAQMPQSANDTHFEVKTEGNTLKLAIAIPEEALKKAIENQKKAAAHMAAMPAQPTITGEQAPAAAAAAPAPPAAAVPAAAPKDGATPDTGVVMLPGKRK